MNKIFLKVNICLFFLILSIGNTLYGQSNDSPNLDVISNNDISWNDWILKTKRVLEQKKFKQSTINYLNKIRFNPRVIELDRKQPEFRLTFDEYLKNIITENNKKKINLHFLRQQKLLKQIEQTFEVNPKILVALWGIETSFGKYTGKLDILRSLASLAYDGRRKEFFSKELENALLILEKNHFKREQFKGSWAGAFGQTQFMPSTFLNHAIDFDGDSKINLFNKSDALASGANYLKKVGWNNSLEWGESVNLEITDYFLSLAKSKKFKSVNFWQKNGIKLNKDYGKNKLKLIIPDSNNNDCYLVSENFDVILDWNRSNYFALTVFLFSDEIK